MVRDSREVSKSLPVWIILVFFLLAAGLGIAGFFYYQKEKERILYIQGNSLISIADLKVRQISAWREERKADAEVIYGSQALARSIERFFQNPHDEALAAELMNWMNALQKNYHYREVILLDLDGTIRLALTEESKIVGSQTAALIPYVAKNARVILSDLYRTPDIKYPHIDLLAPCAIQSNGENKVVAVVLLRIDPQQFLYPLIQAWPVPSDTGESLLVRQERGSVVFLNELRHREGSAIALRLPLSMKDLPAARVALGKEGSFQGRDYRGVPVLSALRHVPNSSWHIVAKLDLQEVFRPIQRQGMLITALVSTMLLAAAATIGLFWRRSERIFFQHHHETELDHLALARQYEYLTRFANDGILLLDRESNILDANERAADLYGYTREELIRMRLGDLQPSLAMTGLSQQMRQAEDRNNVPPFSANHRRRTGERFPVEISLHAIDVEGTCLYQTIIRDVSERKRAEDALRESKEMFASVFRETPAAIMIASMKEGRCMDVNKAFEDVTGFERDQIIGKTPVELGILSDARIIRHLVRMVNERRAISNMEVLFRDRTGRPMMGLLSATQIRVSGEACLLILMTDFTDRKRSEEVTRASEQRFRSVVMQAPVGIFQTDKDSKYIFVNQHWSRITGYSAEEACEREMGSFLQPEERARVFGEWVKARGEGRRFVTNTRLQTADKKQVEVILSIMNMSNDRDEKIGFLGTVTEIIEKPE